MSADATPVRILGAADVAAYRALMLEAYEQAPDAFTTTAAEREAEPESWWVKRIGSADGSATSFGAWKGDRLVGTVALEYSVKPRTRHCVLVLGMYVQPQERGRAIGRALLDAAIAAAAARPGILSLTLTLTEGNAAALHLYRSAGFVHWGTQPQAIRTSAGLKGKVHLTLALSRPDVGAQAGIAGAAGERATAASLFRRHAVRLLPLEADRFDVFETRAVDSFASSCVQAYGLDEATARRWASQQFAALLPAGLQTPGHAVARIVIPEVGDAGHLWWAILDDPRGRHAYIYDLRVDESCRRRGIAGAALAELEKMVRQEGATSVALNVFASNDAAQALYRRCGFVASRHVLRKEFDRTPPPENGAHALRS